ncbi:right-handed parallel beta-helix repeat-containing protein [Paenibacillus sp. N4]|nr:right-handed parallel beta-helix repeat-containing protein [Paenibacillus vietnamensis]
MNLMKALLALLLAVQLSVPGHWLGSAASVQTGAVGAPAVAAAATVQEKYQIELTRFGIRNDGTRPVETTKGINNALAWASKNGKKTVSLPAGTYLIDKSSHISMVGNLTFELPSNAVLQKEPNGKEHYKLMYIGPGVRNVTLKGGVYRGDKDKHDFTKRDSAFTAGTHESGYGIAAEGVVDLTIDGVKAVNFTGDGLVLGGHGTLVKDLYESHFVQGAFNDKGAPVANAGKIRTKEPLTFSHAIFKKERVFELSNAIKLPNTFDIYFYKENGTFLQKLTNKRTRDIMTIPEGAVKFHLVFNQASKKGAYVEFWNRAVSRNVTVKNSEFAFNRRQGITVGGADNVLIVNNSLHDMKGTMPQSGIDLEGGYGENGHKNSNITIRGNKFYNNASYDLILYDGGDAIVEDNHLASKGAIGLAVSEPFKGATVRNNHFDGTRIIAYHDVKFINNKMNNSFTTLTGPNISIDGMEFTDSLFAVSSKVPFGVAVSNVTIKNNKKGDSGLSLAGQPIHIKNLTITGEATLRSFSGTSAQGSIFDNLKIIGYNTTFGLSLPPGTYNKCVFEGAEGGKHGLVSAASAGKYVFDGCTFKAPSSLNAFFLGEHPKLDLTIKNSKFELLGNTQAISIQSAQSVVLENNTVTAGKLTNTGVELIRLNDYWKRNEKHDIFKAVIRGNTITANIAAVGITTVNAGTGAPAYTVENNTLYKAKLTLKSNDASKNNTSN